MSQNVQQEDLEAELDREASGSMYRKKVICGAGNGAFKREPHQNQSQLPDRQERNGNNDL